jgi:hypothetical protein
MLTRPAAFVLAILFASSSGLLAQSRDPARDALMAARSLKCSFPWFASADWDGDLPVLKTSKQDLGFHIDGIDHSKQAARMIGNAGSEDLLATEAIDSISFIEQTPFGTLNVTTVYKWRDKVGRFKSVHSRHPSIGGPAPSQNYGHCEVWQ